MARARWSRSSSQTIRRPVRPRLGQGHKPRATRLSLESLEDRRVLAAGFLDPSFGTNGQVLTGFDGNGLARALVVQDDGKIIAAGQAESGGGGINFALVRYLADGTPDNSFSVQGTVATDFGGNSDGAFAMALQPDGKIVAAGYGFSGVSTDFALARYNTDGSLDTSFGTGGKVLTDFLGGIDLIQGVTIQADGKIVAVGTVGNGNDWAIARYNADGTLDADFNVTGKRILDFGTNFEFAFGVAMQADNKIVVAGSSGTPANRDFAVARFREDGTLDSSFGTGGQVSTDFFGDIDVGRGLGILPDGRIVVGGSASTGASNGFALARYLPNGTLDSDFNATGKVFTNLGGSDLGRGMTVQPDGKVLVVGESTVGGAGRNFGIVRYASDGTLDTSFNVDGIQVNDFAGGNDIAYAAAVQPDGKIVVAGEAANGPNIEFAIARYTGDAPAAPPTVESVVIGDGSDQRSMVTSVTITFSTIVDLDPGAFDVLQVGAGPVALNVVTTVVDGRTVAELTFAGPGIVAGSLTDGNYLLTVHGDAITDGFGRQLDGDADGTAGGNRVDAFFRLFGDASGDGDVDKDDRSLFDNALGTSVGDPLYLAFFDFDSDGDVDRDDRKAFNKRFSNK